MKQNKTNSDNGTVMLEGVIGVLCSMFVLIFLLSFGFYLYQQTMFHIVANKIAEEVVMTYKFIDVEECEDISLTDIENIGRYRYFLFSKYENKSEIKGKNLANYLLPLGSLAKATSEPVVNVKKLNDGSGRMHLEVTLEQDYTFMLGGILELFNIPESAKISSTVYVESVDVSNYINTVKLTNYGVNKVVESAETLENISGILELMYTIFDLL